MLLWKIQRGFQKTRALRTRGSKLSWKAVPATHVKNTCSLRPNPGFGVTLRYQCKDCAVALIAMPRVDAYYIAVKTLAANPKDPLSPHVNLDLLTNQSFCISILKKGRTNLA